MSPSERDALIQEFVLAMRASQNAVDELDQAVADKLGLNRTDLRALDILEREGPMTAGGLAEAAQLTTGALTTVLDRLERAGYARRVRDTVDRRRVLVELTERAHREVGGAYSGLATSARAQLAAYGDGELRFLIEFLNASRTLNEEQAARIRGAGADAAA